MHKQKPRPGAGVFRLICDASHKVSTCEPALLDFAGFIILQQGTRFWVGCARVRREWQIEKVDCCRYFGVRFSDDHIDQRAGSVPSVQLDGCYIGAHVGYGESRVNQNPDNVYGNGFEVAKYTADGGFAGGQLGCNYQFAATAWVIGIEASMSGAHFTGTGLDGYVPLGPYYDTGKVNRLGSLTGRIGWNGFWTPQLLAYVKGGWARSKFEYVNTYPITPRYADNHNRSGWTVGAGAEWAFTQRWSIFLEYDYYDFGTKNIYDDFGNPPFPIKLSAQTVKAGVNFRVVP